MGAEELLRQKVTVFRAVRGYAVDRGLAEAEAETLAFDVIDYYLDAATDDDVVDFVAKSQTRHLDTLRRRSAALSAAERAARDVEISQLEGRLLILQALAKEVKDG